MTIDAVSSLEKNNPSPKVTQSMTIDVNKYPNVIARPYACAIKATSQKKDFQRFLLESTISFLAVVSVSNVVEIYNNLKGKGSVAQDASEPPEKQDILEKIKNKLVVNMDQMALGKWMALLRDTCKVLADCPDNKLLVVPELVDIFKNVANKVVIDSINELITIRNSDAHGSPILEEEFEPELTKRQMLLDLVIGKLNFFENYRILIAEGFVIRDGIFVYSVREFAGEGFSSSCLPLALMLPQNEPILF
ncbi:MAG: hypothetical protein HQK55_19070, partial [Deltaproteobacteria bacterium]|nr:hypothetical protein [Deltaproteobacteria bacterium]